ncbi:TetR/AcrR family transcriptional regulator [uncultured Catenibacterium sp.]|uniref:TetR/AcrR family transcriptional regulator n=1 Tax=uncultured Catenibacterium sp. TaxID=286142 RepID=UPI0025CF1848|nr:TetR/AcrR family transcriptional regulator [uncultured Catenibacterium sp.]
MEIKLSKREQKRQETLNKLLDAMNEIIEKYDYDTLTIRNICSVSGVSYGSFYNLFETKEKFLTYYLTHDFISYKEAYYQENNLNAFNFIEQSIDIFVTCAKYNKSKGLKFISGFYSPNNYDLSPLNMNDHYFCFTPLVEEARHYLTQAKEQHLLKEDAPVEEIIKEYCYIFNGSTFNWCISKAQMDIVQDIKTRLTNYIGSYLDK